MKIVIDDKIPYMRGFAEQLGDTVYLPGANISAADVRDADALIVRTRTKCNQKLLQGSSVKFIATATIGFDHLDTAYLQSAGIHWANCPGCNAASVAQYVECSLLQLLYHHCLDNTGKEITDVLQPGDASVSRKLFSQLRLGIVGVGHVGTQVLRIARKLGFGQILLCDPPRAEREGNTFIHTPIQKLIDCCDIITFHTPLTRQPHTHHTFHLLNEQMFALMRPGTTIINTSRGEVVSNSALVDAINKDIVRNAVIDTWENEPSVDRQLLEKTFIATPHIAGYSADGKTTGTRMALQAVAAYFGADTAFAEKITAPALPQPYAYAPHLTGKDMAEELRLYDPALDTERLRSHPEHFEEQRGNYPLRREKAL